MCNTECNNKPCVHEEDLMCCAPLMHCCGGYSEHNNCCPHDRGCCNCCGCCPCCCHLKKKVNDLEETVTGDNGITSEIDQIKGQIEQTNTNLDDLRDYTENGLNNLEQELHQEVQDRKNADHALDVRIIGLDGRVDVLEDNVEDLQSGLQQEIHDRTEADVHVLNDAKYYSKTYTDEAIDALKGGVGTAYDTLLEIANELNKDDQTEAAILVAVNQTLPGLINTERSERIIGDDALRARIAAEEARAAEAERDLGQDINAENARAITAEQGLGNRITSEINAEVARANLALSTAIDGLDSSTLADNNYALRGIVIENGKIKSNTQIKVPTNNNELVNGKNYQDAAQVSTSISTAIGNLDSNIPAQANKAIASVTEENGILSGTYTDTISKAINDGGGRNIVNTYIDTITAANNQLHYHTGAGTTDITIPYSVKASQDANGDVISNTYLKVAGAATDADATLQSASRTKIATVANTDLHVSLPRLVDNISLTLDPATYKVSATLKGGNTTISTSNEIDLPLETMVVNGSYDSTNKRIILTLKNGQTVSFSVADLVSGLVSTSDLKQSDWNQGNSSQIDYIKNKPTVVSAFTNDAGYITSAQVPAQQQVNWNATSGVTSIANKPNLATVATSGSYNDLTNKPTIPSTNVTIGGTSYTLQQAIDYIIGIIPTQYWSRSNGNLTPATATDTVTAPAFYDSSVN